MGKRPIIPPVPDFVRQPTGRFGWLEDRLLHHAEIVKIEGESYRAKEAKERAAEKARKRAARSKKGRAKRKNADGTNRASDQDRDTPKR